MALAKPVMGTTVPAPAYRATRSNTPMPVSSAVKKTSAIEAKLDAAAAVMRELMADRPRLAALAATGRDYVLKSFSRSTVAASYLQLFTAVR